MVTFFWEVLFLRDQATPSLLVAWPLKNNFFCGLTKLSLGITRKGTVYNSIIGGIPNEYVVYRSIVYSFTIKNKFS